MASLLSKHENRDLYHLMPHGGKGVQGEKQKEIALDRRERPSFPLHGGGNWYKIKLLPIEKR